MKIVDLNSKLIKHPLTGDFHPSWGPGLVLSELALTFIELVLEDGTVGYGALPANENEGVVGLDVFVREQLKGMDVFNTEGINKVLSTASLRMTWPWGVELAAWDAIGKLVNQPINKLLGGYQNKLKIYASFGEIRSSKRRVEDALLVKEKEFAGIKLRFGNDNVDTDLKITADIIRAVGDELDIMVDANQADILPGSKGENNWDFETALYVGEALQDMGVKWLEEPLPRFNISGLTRLNKRLKIPVAGGEKNQMKHEFKQLIEENCYDILQGDAIFSDGLFQLRKIAGFAEMHHKKFIPHTWCNCISLYGNLQLAASLPNCDWFEFPFENPGWTEEVNSFLFKDNLKIEDGFVYVPNKPGLGFIIDNDKIDKYTVY